MGSVNKEQLIKVREFLKSHTNEARELLKENPEILNSLRSNDNNGSNSFNSNLSNEKSMGGKQLTKSIPGIPKMFNWSDDQSGFSNYITLAVLAFVIQFVITLVCIFFYK